MTNNVTMSFEDLLSNDEEAKAKEEDETSKSTTKSKCVACGKMYEKRGWTGLCNRQCYYVIRDLHYSFEKKIGEGENIEPDPRVVQYFTLYPYSQHMFYNHCEEILSYIHYKKTGFHILW